MTNVDEEYRMWTKDMDDYHKMKVCVAYDELIMNVTIDMDEASN